MTAEFLIGILSLVVLLIAFRKGWGINESKNDPNPLEDGDWGENDEGE
jgi:hypothetical protein